MLQDATRDLPSPSPAGVVDLLTLQAYRFEGDNGEKVVITDCPAELKDEVRH